MDDDFLKDLDAAFSSVGADKIWVRKVGGVDLWFSPITLNAQTKISESTMTMTEANVVGEQKRLGLSHSVVGVGERDLRSMRGRPLFPVTGRDGKPTKTTLDRYLYAKMGEWGAQFIDDAYKVYADLMESFERDNLKDVVFENVKHPADELAELTARTAELREQLGLPQLVEAGSQAASSGQEDDEEEEPAPIAAKGKPPTPDFNPFETLSKEDDDKPSRPASIQPPRERPGVIVPPTTESAARAAQLASLEADDLLPPPPPTPVVIRDRPDVLESPASKVQASPPTYNPVLGSPNPRFQPKR